MTLDITVDQAHVTLVCRLVDRPGAVGVKVRKTLITSRLMSREKYKT